MAGSPGVAGPATGSRVSRVAGAVLPGAGHPQGREPAGDVAALEASSPAGRRPEPPPQVPGTVEGLQGETGGSGSVWGGATGSEVRSGPLPEGLAEGLAGDHPEGFSLTGPATGEVFSSGGVGRVREEPAAGAEPVPPDSMDVDDLMSEEDIRACLCLRRTSGPCWPCWRIACRIRGRAPGRTGTDGFHRSGTAVRRRAVHARR